MMLPELEELRDLIASYVTMAKLSEDDFTIMKDSDRNNFILVRWNRKEMLRLSRKDKVKLVFSISFEDVETRDVFIELFNRLKLKLNNCYHYSSNGRDRDNLYKVTLYFQIGKKLHTSRYFRSII